MRKITTQEVQKALYERRNPAIISALSQGMVLMPYKYHHFQDDMSANDFIVDDRTVAKKWKILQVDGIVVQKGSFSKGVQSFLDLSRFTAFMTSGALDLLSSAIEGERHTHINSVNEEVDA